MINILFSILLAIYSLSVIIYAFATENTIGKLVLMTLGVIAIGVSFLIITNV